MTFLNFYLLFHYIIISNVYAIGMNPLSIRRSLWRNIIDKNPWETNGKQYEKCGQYRYIAVQRIYNNIMK